MAIIEDTIADPPPGVPALPSRFLPVRPEDVTQWVFNEDANDLVIWEERLRKWVLSELVPRGDA
jgi:hypothetical protein